MTIVMFVTMASVIIPSLVTVFKGTHYNMEITETEINTYERNELWYIYPNVTTCDPKQGCKEIRVRDIDRLYETDLTLDIYTNA